MTAGQLAQAAYEASTDPRVPAKESRILATHGGRRLPRQDGELIMKLYVWEGVPTDWYSGMIVALAPNLRATKAAARKAYGIPGSDYLEQDLKSKPQVIKITDDTPAQAWTVSGGG